MEYSNKLNGTKQKTDKNHKAKKVNVILKSKTKIPLRIRSIFCHVKYINVTFNCEKIDLKQENKYEGKALEDRNYEESKK